MSEDQEAEAASRPVAEADGGGTRRQWRRRGPAADEDGGGADVEAVAERRRRWRKSRSRRGRGGGGEDRGLVADKDGGDHGPAAHEDEEAEFAASRCGQGVPAFAAARSSVRRCAATRQRGARRARQPGPWSAWERQKARGIGNIDEREAWERGGVVDT